MNNKLKSKLQMGRLIVVLLCCFFSGNLFAQNNNANSGSGKTSYEKYGGQNVETAAESKAEKVAEENIKRAYKVLDSYVEDHVEEIAEFGADQKDKETRFGNEGPERNPLDEQDGKLNEAKSWNEYKTDSKIILKDKTFPICMEPRLLAEKKDGNFQVYDFANIAYALACYANCPDLSFIGLRPNKNWQVFSYYWPEYQVSVNKAGAQMIDPDIVNENRGSEELYRRKTSQSEENDDVRGKQKQVELLEAMGIPAQDSEKFKDPDYHKSPREFHLRQDGELRYPSAMRPNAFWRAANSREQAFEGYKNNKHCFFNSLDLPTEQKKIIANRYDQGIYAILARYPETRKDTDEKRYNATAPSNMKVEEYKDSDGGFKQNLCASWRMGTNSEYYQELEKVGFQQKNDKSMMDYCLPGGYDLSGSMVATPGTPNLQADAARVAMAAVWFGSEESAFKKMNTDKKRTTKYSFYEKRKSSSVNRYVGDETSPGENESKVVFLDKLQRIYPTQKDSGDADGKMGASSKGFRTDQGQRGSQCFRPEDIPNWSSEGDTNKSEWPLGLQGSVEDHYGETRWAIWNRRIACHCEDFGLILGCLNMNDGDSDETVFAGVKEVLEMPPAVKKAIPLIKGYANEQTPPDSPGNADNGLDLNDLTVDVAQLGSGKVNTQMPQGQEQANSPGEQIQQGQDLIICMLAEDRDGKPEEQQQQQQEGQEQANNENPEGGNEAAPGAAPPAAAPPPIFGPGGNPFGPGGINFGPGITPIGGGNQV